MAEDSDPALDLLAARLLVDAQPDDEPALQQALGLLAGVADLPDADMAIASEYTARAHLPLGNLAAALAAIDAAIALEDTPERHALRGQVLEAQGDTDAALREYEWALAWSRITPLNDRLDIRARLDALAE
jgi:tetratricopeptide (TPR) repeat protein